MSRSELSVSSLSAMWRELTENLSQGMVGIFFILFGGFFLVTLRSAGNGVPWLVEMLGWTAPLLTVSLLAIGIVLIFGERAGYWSIEAIVGTQLLLLSLAAGTFAINNPVADWTPTFDGANGGLVGWSLGSLLVSALGQWPAVVLILLVGLVGVALLMRFTPLIYTVAFVFSLVPALHIAWEQSLHRRAAARELTATKEGRSIFAPPSAAQTRSYVAAEEPDDFAASDALPSATVSDAKGTFIDADPRVEHNQTPQRAARTSVAQANPAQPQKPVKRSSKGPKPARKPEQLPPFELLDVDSGIYGASDNQELLERIEQTLEDFNVPVKVVHVESGPTVTQFGVEPLYLERAGQRRKIRVNRIVSLADDLALALEAPSIRIEAPVPGRPYVGIEVPNSTKTMVSLGGIAQSREWVKEGGYLTLGLGRNTAGKPVIMDLARAPHMLIAGATGAGKSVCINTIITSLLMQHGPETLRFLMVDPKMVELPGYNGIPHLIGKVVTEMDQVMGLLTWLLLQMDDRYRLFKEHGTRNLESFNAKVKKMRNKDAPKPLPFMVLIVDELADLMMTAADDVERQLCRLAQMARATGIHLILATQRPSTDVVTGLIKANFPTRIAFSVTSQIDSRVIMDTPGAERLLGSGDMLLMRPDSSKLFRVQGCFVSDTEIGKVVKFWKDEAQAVALENGETTGPVIPPWNGLLDRMDDGDELIYEAMDVLRDMETCSTSMLQRKMRIGYPKAARLMEDLEAKKIVGPDLGGGQGRPVLINDEEEADSGEDEEDLF